MIDQNGEKCALIKVVTTQSGFGWEGGMLGIVKVEPKIGEFWVYVPHGAKKITIKHPQLGILRNYVFTEAIDEATVYEMILTTDEVTTVVKKREIKSVWLMINSNPSRADLYIDETYVGQTPFQKKLKKQNYDFRLSKVKYQSTAGIIDLTDIEDKKLMEINLKSDFGKINITSNPENGASVFLDDINTSKLTPCSINEIKSGTHRITLRKEWYEPITKEFTIIAEEEKSFKINLIQSFGELKITTNPKADIFIDNEKKGFGEYNCRLSPGIYSVKAQKENHNNAEESIEIIVGEVKNINLNPQPQYASIDITTTPWGADIIIGSKNYGKTPKTIEKILVGKHNIRLEKEGFPTINKTVTLKEGQKESLTAEFVKEKKIFEFPEMVFVKGGSFQMGSNDGGSDEKPIHTVSLDDFHIGKYEVTQKQWTEIMGSNPSNFKGDNLPVEKVTWNEVQEFIKKLNERTNQKYRLPTEAEWEYAARGGINSSKQINDIISAKDFIKKYKTDKNLVVIDISEQEQYSKAHIKDAINIPYHLFLTNNNKVLAKILGGKGISNENNLIIYEENSLKKSKEVQSILISLDVNNVSVLSKDMKQWRTARIPLTRVISKRNSVKFSIYTIEEKFFLNIEDKSTTIAKYSGSNNIDDVAWYKLNSGKKTHTVGTKKANKLGIYDMSGNVWEWCSDLYGSNYYKQNQHNNPQGPVMNSFKDSKYVCRGGSWSYSSDYCRVASRSSFSSNSSYNNLGFRLVKSVSK